MPLIPQLAVVQTRVKDTVASSPVVGLAVRANGEEVTCIIDRNGNAYPAGIPEPTTAPSSLTPIAGGTLALGKWYAWRYCYAASKAYPLVENEFAINGELIPRGNASPMASKQLPSSGSNKTMQMVLATLQTAAGRPDVDTIWLFRTGSYSTQAEAENAAIAGLCYYIKSVPNNPAVATVLVTDGNGTQGVDQLESDNFFAPTFQYVIYYDPYWYGFGNNTFRARVTWDSSGTMAILEPDTKWFTGRNGQYFSLTGITDGGFDGAGGYKFKWLSHTTAQATLDGVANAGLPAMPVGENYITIQGPPTTLYRSKRRNPLSWGWTRIIGTLQEAQVWALKVGGGLGTAIASVPNEPILKLDTEFPAKCYSYNLQQADAFDNFKQTQRIVSDVFSVTSHFSQFVAQTSSGGNVLWGMDFKNFAIVQSNGISQVPVSVAIPKILRRLTNERQKQLLAHGVYDPYTECNCIWVTTADAPGLVNLLLYQHAPTGFWGFSDEKDVLCSAAIPDLITGEVRVLVGTETGLFGQAFVPSQYSNWVPPTGTISGHIATATLTTITAVEAASVPFDTVAPGLVGNWCLITDAAGENEQWARISVVEPGRLTFDLVWVNGDVYTQLQPVPDGDSTWLFYIGVIECRAKKYFDFGMPITDKQLLELWLSQTNIDLVTGAATLIRFYKEWEETHEMQFVPEQNIYSDSLGSDVWFAKGGIPSELMKFFGLEIINRGYSQWKFRNLVLKPRIVQ